MKLCSYDLPTVIRLERERAGYTNREDADGEACSSRYLGEFERGNRRPKPDTAVALAETFQSRKLLEVYCGSCPVKQAMYGWNKISCSGQKKNHRVNGGFGEN